MFRQAQMPVRPGSPSAGASRLGAIPTPVRGLAPLLALLIFWQLAGDNESLSLPPPGEWLRALAALHDDGALFPALLVTLTTFTLALVASAALGATAGAAIGASRQLDRALTPTLEFLATVPGVAYVPVAVLLLGYSQFTSVAIVGFAVVWPVLLNAAMAMRTIPAVRLDAARTIGLTRGERWRKVLLPSLAPAIILGMRVVSSIALIVSLLVDLIGAGDGVGRLMIERQQQLDAASVWGLLAIVGTFGYLTSVALAWLDRCLLRNWPE